MVAQNEQSVPGPVNPEDSVTDFLTVAELLTEPQLARLYTFILREGPTDVETIKKALDLPHSTAYKYVDRLGELGVLTRHNEQRPAMMTVDSIHVQLETEHGPVAVTPVLVDAVGRQLDNEDIRVFLERNGIPKLAAALHYTLRIENEELTQRTAATRLGVHPVEGMTVFTALQDIVDEVGEYDPFLTNLSK